MQTTHRKYDVDQKLDEFKINGFVVFDGFIPVEKVDRMYAAFLPLLEAVRQRDDPASAALDNSGAGNRRRGQGQRQNVNRYTVEVPWEMPFADPEIYEHPVLLEFLDKMFGHTNYILPLYSSNNPYPGSEYQQWHRDIRLFSPYVASQLPAGVGIKFPLVDTNEENGSFEIIPCTQHLADPGIESRLDETIKAGEYHPMRLNLKKGALWIQDPRPIHRGTPNNANHVRPELVIAYYEPWYDTRRHIEMSEAESTKLSDRAKKMLRTARII